MKRINVALLAIFTMASSLFAELSTNQVAEIADAYAKACVTRDHQAWTKLFYLSSWISEPIFKGVIDHGGYGINSTNRAPVEIVIQRVDGHDVHLQIKGRNGKVMEGWLQLLPNGRIKYDPLLNNHPIHRGFLHINILKAMNTESPYYGQIYDIHLLQLQDAGIPLFGLAADTPVDQQKTAFEEIWQWLKENGKEWDHSDPKLACPIRQYFYCLKRYK